MENRNIAKLILVCLLAACLADSVPAATISADLAARLRDAAAGERIPVIVNLADRVDVGRFVGGRAAAASLITDLRATASRTQAPVIARLRARGAGDELRSLWITNSLALGADPSLIRELARWPELAGIDLDVPVGLPPVVTAGGGRDPVWNLQTIGAPEVWETYGLTGEGVVIGSMDTGADIDHPALQGKWRGGDNSWLDLVNGLGAPYDDHGHGTHTIGTLVGGDGPGPFAMDIGVAFGAQFIAVKVLDQDNSFSSASIVIEGAQWILDPDGDAATDDFPSVVNNSWYFYSQTYTGFNAAAAAWRAAGIVPVFCLGNEGPNPGTTRPPGNYNNTLGIGATTSADAIWYYSSRGPSPAGPAFPPDRRKPDVSAPGDFVLSSLPGGGYEAWSGTSMATPHVAGTVALLLQHRPDLTYDDLFGLLTSTSVDLGVVGWDRDFGYGRLDAFAAASALFLTPTPDPPSAVAPCRFDPGRPNPFNPATVLGFELAAAGDVDLSVYDLRGRLVSTLEHGRLPAGPHERTWHAQDSRGQSLPSGVYLARLSYEGKVFTQALNLAR